MTPTTWSAAYETGIGRTIAFLCSRGVGRDLAPDIAQGAWMHGWQLLGQLRDERFLTTWVNSIALNQYRMWLRSRRQEEPVSEQCAGGAELNWAAIDVGQILRRCRPGHRAVLEAQLMGRTSEEIARQFGITATAARIRLVRARRAARELMTVRGTDGSGFAVQ